MLVVVLFFVANRVRRIFVAVRAGNEGVVDIVGC